MGLGKKTVHFYRAAPAILFTALVLLFQNCNDIKLSGNVSSKKQGSSPSQGPSSCSRSADNIVEIFSEEVPSGNIPVNSVDIYVADLGDQSLVITNYRYCATTSNLTDCKESMGLKSVDYTGRVTTLPLPVLSGVDYSNIFTYVGGFLGNSIDAAYLLLYSSSSASHSYILKFSKNTLSWSLLYQNATDYEYIYSISMDEQNRIYSLSTLYDTTARNFTGYLKVFDGSQWNQIGQSLLVTNSSDSIYWPQKAFIADSKTPYLLMKTGSAAVNKFSLLNILTGQSVDLQSQLPPNTSYSANFVGQEKDSANIFYDLTAPQSSHSLNLVDGHTLGDTQQSSSSLLSYSYSIMGYGSLTKVTYQGASTLNLSYDYGKSFQTVPFTDSSFGANKTYNKTWLNKDNIYGVVNDTTSWSGGRAVANLVKLNCK